MRRRIFVAIAGIAVAASLAAFALVFVLFQNELRTAMPDSTDTRLLFPILLLLALCCAAAALAAARIVRPLKSAKPDAYKELQPLYRRVEEQRRSLKAGAEELEEKQLSLNTVMENMTEGLILLDASALIVSINKSACAMLSLHGELVGKDIMAVHRDEMLQAAVFAALGGASSEELLCSDNCSIQLVAHPIRVDGAVRGVVLLLFDVTERVVTETMRREFSANVSHELKTPLTSISGYAEIMRDGLVRSEDMAGFAGKIYDEAQRLIALIEDIIKLSRLDENADIDIRPVDLHGICLQVSERLREKAEHLRVHVEVQGGPCVLRGNARLLDEMVYNLCENAIKYNRPDGWVFLRISVEEGWPLLEVEDTGIGIPREHQNRVFERFYRVDKSHSRETGGTGLGLSIVKHVALVHGASIELESTSDRGTTIRLRFGKNDS